MILNCRETFGSLGNQIELALFEVEAATAYDLHQGMANAATEWGITNLVLL